MSSGPFPGLIPRTPIPSPDSTEGADVNTQHDHPEHNRWLALYVLCAGVLMIVLDITIVNVALPSIKDDLGFSQGNLAWVVNAYLIPFGGLLLLAGRLGDLLGQRRVFLAGLAVFVSASLLCALSQSQEMLIGARFIPGIGGALTSALVLGVLVTVVISWHCIFFINSPVGIATALLTRRLVEDSEGIGIAEGADVPGALLITSSLMLGTYTILEVSEVG